MDATRQLLREMKRMQQNPPPGISAGPEEDNILWWNAAIVAPDVSPWRGGFFQLKLYFPSDYPNSPPTVQFSTPIFHPNIYADGSLCLDILLPEYWTPVYDVAAILATIQQLLNNPNPKSPANVKAASLYKENRKKYNNIVKEYVQRT